MPPWLRSCHFIIRIRLTGSLWSALSLTTPASGAAEGYALGRSSHTVTFPKHCPKRLGYVPIILLLWPKPKPTPIASQVVRP